jgi:hypothetical protein
MWTKVKSWFGIKPKEEEDTITPIFYVPGAGIYYTSNNTFTLPSGNYASPNTLMTGTGTTYQSYWNRPRVYLSLEQLTPEEEAVALDELMKGLKDYPEVMTKLKDRLIKYLSDKEIDKALTGEEED